MSIRRRIRKPVDLAIAEESKPEEAQAKPVSKEEWLKVTLQLRRSVAIRLHSNAYEMGRDKGEMASDLLDRGMRPLKADKRFQAVEAESQGQEGEAA